MQQVDERGKLLPILTFEQALREREVRPERPVTYSSLFSTFTMGVWPHLRHTACYHIWRACLVMPSDDITDWCIDQNVGRGQILAEIFSLPGGGSTRPAYLLWAMGWATPEFPAFNWPQCIADLGYEEERQIYAEAVGVPDYWTQFYASRKKS